MYNFFLFASKEAIKWRIELKSKVLFVANFLAKLLRIFLRSKKTPPPKNAGSTKRIKDKIQIKKKTSKNTQRKETNANKYNFV